MNHTDRLILSAATMTREQRQLLALDLGMSVPVMLQRMLKLADDPAVIAEMPAECRLIRSRRDAGRARRSGVRLVR